MPQNFKKLIVYQEGYQLSKEIYNEVEKIERHFRLRDQLFAAITSVPANLAEMGSFDNQNQRLQKLRVCIGEANEAEFWLDFCNDVGLIDEAKHKDFVNRVKKLRMMLYSLLEKVRGDKNGSTDEA